MTANSTKSGARSSKPCASEPPVTSHRTQVNCFPNSPDLTLTCTWGQQRKIARPALMVTESSFHFYGLGGRLLMRAFLNRGSHVLAFQSISCPVPVRVPVSSTNRAGIRSVPMAFIHPSDGSYFISGAERVEPERVTVTFPIARIDFNCRCDAGSPVSCVAGRVADFGLGSKTAVTWSACRRAGSAFGWSSRWTTHTSWVNTAVLVPASYVRSFAHWNAVEPRLLDGSSAPVSRWTCNPGSASARATERRGGP